VLFDREEIEEVRSCDDDNVSRVGARVVDTEPVEVMVLTPLRRRIEGKERGGREEERDWNEARDAVLQMRVALTGRCLGPTFAVD
jgi:hypothetical protein